MTNLSEKLESFNPRLAGHALSLASQVSQPMYLGKGLKVRHLDDTRVWTELPFDFRNQKDMTGPISISRLAQLGEYTVECLLNRHLHQGVHQLALHDLRVSVERPILQTVWCRFHWQQEELNDWLHNLKSRTESQTEFLLWFLSTHEAKLGEISIKVAVTNQLSLNSPPGIG